MRPNNKEPPGTDRTAPCFTRRTDQSPRANRILLVKVAPSIGLPSEVAGLTLKYLVATRMAAAENSYPGGSSFEVEQPVKRPLAETVQVTVAAPVFSSRSARSGYSRCMSSLLGVCKKSALVTTCGAGGAGGEITGGSGGRGGCGGEGAI